MLLPIVEGSKMFEKGLWVLAEGNQENGIGYRLGSKNTYEDDYALPDKKYSVRFPGRWPDKRAALQINDKANFLFCSSYSLFK